MAFDKRSVDGVGEREFSEVLGGIVLVLICLETVCGPVSNAWKTGTCQHVPDSFRFSSERTTRVAGS